MSRRRPLPPPTWSEDRLEKDREKALAAFIKERGEEGTQVYLATFAETETVVRRLFDVTSDLQEFTGKVFQENADLVESARYLAGPPVSADDLATLVEGQPRRKSLEPELAMRVADVLRSVWDPIRFPWIEAGRKPTKQEREAAIKWTASIWAVERIRTRRRTESSKRQEAAVAESLQAAKFEQVPRLGRMDTLDELARGTFTRETTLAGAKCDVPVRLHDGRLLAIECKVSNSAVNSVKRLTRETGGKARAWKNAFGLQVVTGAVLAGVFTLGNLMDAQENYEISIFWEHDLGPLKSFVRRAK